MPILPIAEAVARFQGNDERIEQFVNDPEGLGFYLSSGGEPVKSLPAISAEASSLEARLTDPEHADGNVLVARSSVTVESIEDLQNLAADRKLLAQLQLGHRSGAFEYNPDAIGDEWNAMAISSVHGGAWIRRREGAPKAAWWKQGEFWVSAEVQAAIDYVSDKSLGELDCNGEQIIGLLEPLFARSNVTILLNGGRLNNSAPSAPQYTTIFLGQCNREDLARVKGVEETAHSIGSLSTGDTAINIGLRWNNASGSFDNPADYIPQVGDLVTVATTDNTGADPARPVPSFTMHRKVVGVSGSTIRIDKGVIGTGNYMLIPMSRGLGYDRSTYGGIGRMYAVENFYIQGDEISSDNGYAFITGACIGGAVEIPVHGKAGIFGNGVRETIFDIGRCSFSRVAVELAVGSEYPVIKRLIATHFDAGDSLDVACIQTGELCVGAQFDFVRIDAKSWAGATGTLLTGLDTRILDLEITTAATGKVISFGSSAWPTTIAGDKIRAESIGSVTGLLAESDTNSRHVIRDLRVTGSTSLADAAILRAAGKIDALTIGPDTGAVRISGALQLGESNTAGSLVNINTRISSSRIKGRISEYITTANFTPNYIPTSNFRMSLTGNVEVATPSGTYEVGDAIEMIFEQDGTGGRTVTFAAGNLYRGMGAIGSGTASQRRTLKFRWTGSVWACVASNGSWLN